MFQLAVEYLLDDDGLGRSLDDMRNLIIDVGEGSTFAAAFESRMGIGLDDYETRFFDLMDDYLPQHRNPLFSPAWFAILSLAVTAFVLGVPALVYRRASTAAVEEPGRLASIGFHAGMILSSAMLLGVFLVGLFQVGTDYELNNAVYASGRTRAYWILVGFLAVSVGLDVVGGAPLDSSVPAGLPRRPTRLGRDGGHSSWQSVRCSRRRAILPTSMTWVLGKADVVVSGHGCGRAIVPTSPLSGVTAARSQSRPATIRSAAASPAKPSGYGGFEPAP